MQHTSLLGRAIAFWEGLDEPERFDERRDVGFDELARLADAVEVCILRR